MTGICVLLPLVLSFHSFGPGSDELSNEKNLGWLGYTRDYCILPSYIGIIIINHYKDPY